MVTTNVFSTHLLQSPHYRVEISKVWNQVVVVVQHTLHGIGKTVIVADFSEIMQAWNQYRVWIPLALKKIVPNHTKR